MSAPALEVMHERGISAATPEFGPEEPPARALRRAFAVSALVHALLFLAIGVATFQSSTTPIAAPELRLYVESSEGSNPERDLAGGVERPAAPTTQSREEVVASLAGVRSVVVRSPSGSAAPSTPAKPDETRSDSGQSVGDADSDTAGATGSVEANSPVVTEQVVTTFAPSEREEPTPAESPKPRQPPGVPIGSAQETTLARWILQAAQGLRDANQTQARLSLQHKGRRYTAFLERRPAADDMGIDRVRAEITTEENGKRLLTLLELKQLAFSHFAQLVDYWDPGEALHADAIEGRFHSNSEIRIRSDRFSPQVLGKLTTAASRVDLLNGGPRAMHRMFPGGVETNAPRIALPAASPAFIRDHADASKVHTFTHSTRVTFYADGSYGWRELAGSGPEQRETVSAPHYIVASRGATVAVRGTVSGTVVVYSPDGIVVEGSLVYAHDPHSDPGAGDYLGLISGKDIEVAPPRVTGPGDLEIHAAIYAKRRFIVNDNEAPGGPTTCPCAATLSICGSLTAGSLSPTEPRYATRYEFDRRFEQVRPPGFPVTDRYEVDTWDAQWRLAESDPSPDSAEAVR